MEHVALIANEFKQAGFKVRVNGIHVQPTLNRRIDRREIETIVADYLEDGLVRVTRGTNGYWVSINA